MYLPNFFFFFYFVRFALYYVCDCDKSSSTSTTDSHTLAVNSTRLGWNDLGSLFAWQYICFLGCFKFHIFAGAASPPNRKYMYRVHRNVLPGYVLCLESAMKQKRIFLIFLKQYPFCLKGGKSVVLNGKKIMCIRE